MKQTTIIKSVVFALVFLGIILSWQKGSTSAFGPGGGYSNAPSESNCANCHLGTSLTTGASLISLTANGSSTLKYKTDSTYTIVVKASKSGISTWGFETTALKDSTNTSIGTLSVSTSDVQTTTATISGKSRSYVEHTSSGTSGSGGRSWSFSWKAPHTDVGTITFYVIVNAANGDANNTGDVVYANTFTFSHQPLFTPVAGFTFSPSSICEKDSISFKDTSTLSPTSWAWTFVGGSPSSSTLQNPKVAFNVWGGHKVTLVATNKFGASGPVSKTVSVIQQPSDTIYRSGPTTFCDGDSVLLTADFAGSTFKWSNGSTFQAISVKKAGTYYCTVTNGICSKVTKPVTIKLLPKPSIALTRFPDADTICKGDTLTYTLTTSGVTHSFYNNGISLPKSSGLVYKNATLAGNTNHIFALAVDSLGCISDTSKIYRQVIHVRLTAPVLTAGPSTTQSVTVNWTAVSGAKGYEVSTDSGTTWKAPSGTLTHTQNGLPSNTYINILVRAKDQPCPGLTKNIIVSSLPCSQTTYSLRVDSMICPNTTAKVVFSKISAKHFSITVNGNTAKDTAFSFSPIKDTIVHFSMYDSLKSVCGAFSIDVPVKIVPIDLKMSINSDKPYYCGLNTASTITESGSYDEYDIFANGVQVARDSSGIYKSTKFKDGDRVVVRGKLQGCFSDSSNAIIMHKYIPPVAGFNFTLDTGRLVRFADTSSNDFKRKWNFGDGGSDTAAKPTHTYPNDYYYTIWLIVESKQSCVDSAFVTTFVKLLNTDTSTGVARALVPETLRIMPNPFQNSLHISFYGNKAGYLHLIIADVQGRVEKDIHTKYSIGNNDINIDVDNLKQGPHILKMDDGTQVIGRQIIKN